MLDAYANQISSRSSSLDTRADSLRSGEKSLREWESRLEIKQAELADMELSLRREMTDFLNNLARRERRVAELEAASGESVRRARAASAAVIDRESAFSEKLDSASGQLSDLSHVADELQRTRMGLQAANRVKEAVEADINSRKVELDSLISERDRLRSVVEHARGVDSAANELKSALASREKLIASHERRLLLDLPKVDTLDAALDILRDFLRRELRRQNHHIASPFAGLTEVGVAAMGASELCLLMSDVTLYLSGQADSIERMRAEAESRSSALQSREVKLLRDMRGLAKKRAFVELDTVKDGTGFCSPRAGSNDEALSPPVRSSPREGAKYFGQASECERKMKSPGYDVARVPDIVADRDGYDGKDIISSVDAYKRPGKANSNVVGKCMDCSEEYPRGALYSSAPPLEVATRQSPKARSPPEDSGKFWNEAERSAKHLATTTADRGIRSHSDSAPVERLNSFLASRWLWKERLARLVTVVGTLVSPARMYGKEAIIASVQDRLSKFLEETDHSGNVDVQSPVAREVELALQRRWTSEIQTIVEVVGEVQAWVLHAAKHDDDGLLYSMRSGSHSQSGSIRLRGIDDFLHGTFSPTLKTSSSSGWSTSDSVDGIDGLADAALHNRVQAALQGYEEMSRET